MPLRILQVIASRGFYGAERVATQLCRSLTKRGCEAMLVLLGWEQAALVEEFRKACGAQVNVVPVACRGRVDGHAVMELLRRLRDADVLHTHGYKADLYGLAAARMAGAPVVATCHNWTASDRSLRVYRGLDQWGLRWFDGCVAVSGYVAEQLVQAGIAAERVQVIANGVEVKQVGDRVQEPVIGVLSRLSREKGVDVLLRALPVVRREFPRVRCVVGGDGPERERLESLATELGVSDAVRMAGFLPAEDVLGASRVFVLPSRTEGTPMSLLEAMAAAKPIVAAAVGGVPRIVENERSGLLVPAEDPEALARAIVRMLRDAEGAERMGARAREHVREHFSVDVMIDRYMSLYADVMERHGKCREHVQRDLEKVQG